MSEIRDVCDSSLVAGSLAELSDPSKRRDHYIHLFAGKSKKVDIPDIQHVILWLQDPWSEIRKDCARWIKSNRLDILPDAENLLLLSLIDCMRCDHSSWQATHGSLLGITQLICQTCVQSICYEVRDLCLSLVGSNLAPVREAATACVCKLISSGKISTAVLISTIQLSVLNLYEKGDNMTVANEIDGLLGCLSDTIESSMTVDMEKSSSLSTDLKSFFNIMEKEYRTLEDSQELDGKQHHSLLTRVISTVFLIMGHTSSIVRQHAGQVFLRIYYLLPATSSPSSSEESGQYRSDHIKCKAPAISPLDQNDENYISQYLVDSRGGMLGIISNALTDRRKWQRQEVSLIVSEDIIETILFAALEAMGQKSWKGFTVSDCEHVLIASCRESSWVSLLHPMFEVRRMHGQILPTVARASILFQPDMLVEEFISSNRNTMNGLTVPTGLSYLISTSNNDNVEDERDEDSGDCRPVVLCAWIACLCNAAEHIIELDTGSNSHFQEALLRSKIDRITVDSPPTPYAFWAMDVLGRLSEEVSKKRYSTGLKRVLYGENLSAYTALATSLSCVRNILGEVVQLLWSPGFDKKCINSSSSCSSNSNGNNSNSNSSSSSGSDNSNSSGISIDGTHTSISAKKLLLSDAISCDFIDAAVLSAALLQKLDHDKFSSIVAHTLQSLPGVPLKRSADKAVSDVSTAHVRRKSFDDSNNDINRCRVSEEKHYLLPVFLICMRAIMKSAKNQYALHSHSHSHSNSHSVSRGSSCRSTPCSSPLKQSHHFPCRIDMRPYSVGNTEHDIGSNGYRISSPRSFISSSSLSSTKKIIEIRELEKTSFNINGSPSSICNEEHSSSPSQIRGFAFALRKHSLSKTLTPSVIASAPKSISFPDALHFQQVSDRSSNNQYLTHWVLVPSLMDPTTDLSEGILKVESSSISTHRWLCESLAPLLPSLVPALSALGCAILASVVADWSLSIAFNSLWMDSRVSARKALFSSLPLLIEKASHALIRPILFTDSYLHDQDDKHLFVTTSVEEQVYSYLSEASTTCMAALCAETPGLDPHSVGCLLKALRLCRTCPEVVVKDRGSDSTSFCKEADEREREGHTEREGDRESLETNPSFSHFKNAITVYALKYCDVRTSTVTSYDDVIIGNPIEAIGELSNGSSSRPIHVESEKEEEENVMREEVECEEAEFSDWDEEEDSENEHVNRRGTLYPCDDLTALQDEIEMLQCHYKLSITNFH